MNAKGCIRAAMASAALALFAGGAQAQDASRPAAADTDYRGQVSRYLQEQATKHVSDGFRRETAIPDLIAPLRLEGGVLWRINLRRGVAYRVFAVCDNDCSDVDLEVYDDRGAFVGRDIATNDRPFVEITPERDGAHYARIWLAACESEPCYVGARVYRR
jgi:hypothetical protein